MLFHVCITTLKFKLYDKIFSMTLIILFDDLSKVYTAVKRTILQYVTSTTEVSLGRTEFWCFQFSTPVILI